MNSPYSAYPQGHQDVFASLLQSAQAANDMESARRQSELGKQTKQFAQQYALQGLQNQIQSQVYGNNLAQAKLDGVFGPAGNILRGLFD
jgi:hypothetical protein